MERSRIEEIAQSLRAGEPLSEDERRRIANLLMAVGQEYYDRTGVMFISGYAGALDEMGLPEHVIIVPEYGVDATVFGVYKREKQ